MNCNVVVPELISDDTCKGCFTKDVCLTVTAYEERVETIWSNTLYWSTIKQAWLLKPQV